ncbi:uncharacterized protein PRCAT00006107001 [Priceomyces carsonii]|uniref:uncharacterized protein n=1 Tax=Priceomyces carsonii TaxID=28549 RepID=UPI002EDA17FF|nr:unnamed protein product [Priceomyces carsonii]
MNFNYPEFLKDSSQNDEQSSDGNLRGFGHLGDVNSREFNALLLKKLEGIDESPLGDGHINFGGPNGVMANNSPFTPNFGPQKDAFNLPSELKGGVGNISSRRPSYAAESITRSSGFANQNIYGQPNNLASLAVLNSMNHNPQFLPLGLKGLNEGFADINLNSGFDDFQARRPSQLVDYMSPPPSQSQQPIMAEMLAHGPKGNIKTPHAPSTSSGVPGSAVAPAQMAPPAVAPSNSAPNSTSRAPEAGSQAIKLENGLILKDQYIVASPELKQLYLKTMNYYQNPELSNKFIYQLNSLLSNTVIVKLVQFIKNLNNLTFNHKILCLVVNKNGKLDSLSYPDNSNIFLQKNDLVIVDGDRGKDLVMILEPLVNLNFAILFNFLKKIEHLKSLSINDEHHTKSGTHSTQLNASSIVNNHSNEDNEFIISLPTKQVLRFATPKEVQKISGKFLEEKKAFTTCFNKIKELNLQNDLRLINVEYQSDFKKLIFYYFANFKRIDFRGLIKELFKIYKTRIWLCAVLPYDNPKSYYSVIPFNTGSMQCDNAFPKEYELSNDQILNFSIDELENAAAPNYFHTINLLNLVGFVSEEITGNFYGFNNPERAVENLKLSINKATSSKTPNPCLKANKITPNFNPFND